MQDQVRTYGGLEALVSCCRHDENNPYIREHAIMCLRFAVEGCEANGEVIRAMAGKSQARQQQGQQRRGRQLMGGSVTLEGGLWEQGQGFEGDVPSEVLDTSGYETFMDGKGQVGLRRKGGPPAAAASAVQQYSGGATGGAYGAGSSSSAVGGAATAAAGGAPSSSKHYPLPPPRLSATKMTAEKAAELMQNALRDLPLGDKLVTDRQKAEALAKLDRAFESTEKVLGRGVRNVSTFVGSGENALPRKGGAGGGASSGAAGPSSSGGGPAGA